MRDDGKRQPGQAAPPIQPQPILVSRVLEVGPPLVPRQPPVAPAPAQPKSATSNLGAMPPLPSQPPIVQQPQQPQPQPPQQQQPARRPAAPNVNVSAPPTEGESLWDSVEALLDDVDAGFGAIIDSDQAPRTERLQQAAQQQQPTTPSRPPTSGGLSSARELFVQLATAHVRHVRDFMIDVKTGQATAEWLALCEPAVRSVRQMAEQLELRDLVSTLDAYMAALKLSAESAGVTIDAESCARLLAAYEPLITMMPSAFSLDAVKSRRDGIILSALLLQIPNVRKVTIDKLYAAGLTTLDAFFVARADEIAMTAGIDVELAQKIVERFVQYKRDTQTVAVDEDRTEEHARLKTLVDLLARQHAAFEQAEKAGDSAKKRATRKGREAALLAIKVLLARLGEEERATAIDKVPFAQKVAELKKLVEGS